MAIQRRLMIITGQVQGVGFRPFVYRLARENGLSGLVGNTPEGVRMEIQGEEENLRRFARLFPLRLPPLARVGGVREGELPVLPDEEDFRIILSEEGGHKGHAVLVSPDVGVCANCLEDILTIGNRRHGYAFTNCTDCGPRYSITRSIPYDRPVTSMACFPLCPDCAREYADPMDRRFHAQPNACPVCGPALWLEGKAASPLSPGGTCPPPGMPQGKEALLAVLAAMRGGSIAAIKGLGGFHLACDAYSSEAVAGLRRRKNRPHKALAVMVADVGQARQLARISPEAEAALLSPERPIVVCPRLGPGSGERSLPAILSPDSADIGLMLPSTPLHHLLFHPEALGGKAEAAPAALVMTSGNTGGDPLCLGNREAREKLAGIADLFLFHNRDILVRVDDSVIFPGKPSDSDAWAEESGYPAAPRIMLRRARGFVPSRLELPGPDDGAASLLAVGAELKHTFCLTRGREAFVSQHTGSLNRPGTLAFFRESLVHLSRLLEINPVAVIRDVHPDYPSSLVAEEYARERGIPVLRLQHHKAHVHAVLAENSHFAPALGMALDGSGLGDDGTVWGGELFLANPRHPGEDKRLGHFRPFALPGGEAAIRAPWRIAESLWELAGLPEDGPRPWDREPGRAAMLPMLREMLRRNVHCLPTSSCGRLFDAVSALCGLCFDTSYEGQAAILLEEAQDRNETGAYPFPLLETEEESGAMLVPDSWALFRAVADDLSGGASRARAARRFHLGLARGLAAWAEAAAARTGVVHVALGGGVMNNRTLSGELPRLLRRRGLRPLLAVDFPPGDGSISLGQAAWGRRAVF